MSGAYISVRASVEMIKMGETVEQILEAYEKLTLAQVYDALSYYHDHTAEIDGSIRANKEAGKEARRISREIDRQRKKSRQPLRLKKAGRNGRRR